MCLLVMVAAVKPYIMAWALHSLQKLNMEHLELNSICMTTESAYSEVLIFLSEFSIFCFIRGLI